METLKEKVRVKEKSKPSDILVRFILGVLTWNKSFMWNEPSSTLLIH